MIGDKNAIFVVHTVAVSQTEIMGHFHDLAPSVIIRNIVDDSLLTEVIRNDGVTTHVRQRMIDYFIGAQNAGADVILNQCSSVGEVAEFAQELVDIPIVRIDRRMARNACGMGNRIGVVATLPTTMGPTCRLIQRSADALGKSIEITEGLAAGAFDALIAGDRAVQPSSRAARRTTSSTSSSTATLTTRRASARTTSS